MTQVFKNAMNFKGYIFFAFWFWAIRDHIFKLFYRSTRVRMIYFLLWFFNGLTELFPPPNNVTLDKIMKVCSSLRDCDFPVPQPHFHHNMLCWIKVEACFKTQLLFFHLPVNSARPPSCCLAVGRVCWRIVQSGNCKSGFQVPEGTVLCSDRNQRVVWKLDPSFHVTSPGALAGA